MIQKVEVIPGCISCRNCESVCPDIFHVAPKSKVISHDYAGKEGSILQAEKLCPVQVIKVAKSGNFTIHFRAAKLIKKIYLTQNIIELHLEIENFSAQAGQYISLQMHDAWGKFSRSYSIARHDEKLVVLNIKLEKKGRGARYIKKLQAGKTILFLGPLGNFTLKNQESKKRKVFIATGTGLAPLYNMLLHLPNSTQKLLILGCRYENDIYYQEELKKIQNLELILCISRPKKEHIGQQGRVTDVLDKIKKDEEVYICGNPHMTREAKHTLLQNGHEKEKIFDEAYVESPVHKGSLRDVIFNGSLPYTHHISWIIILFSLLIIPTTWYYQAINKELYGEFLFLENYMGFLYDLSWWSVVFVMAIRPLKDLFPKIGLFRSLCYFRKAFGILSASIIVSNWLGTWIIDPRNMMMYFTLARFEIWNGLIARLSEITAIILLITSNTLSQKILGKGWKYIQKTSYIYFISGALLAAEFFPYKIYPAMSIVIMLFICAFIKNTFFTQR